jgi:citrate synthase
VSTDAENGGDAKAKETLTVIDNRTGERYDVAVVDGAFRPGDLRPDGSAGAGGLLSYDPALTNTAACRSAITFVDGERGVLQHRGYPIEQLVEQSSYLEVAYLLVDGELPTQEQFADWVHNITIHRFVHENVTQFLEGFRHDAPPMGMLLSTVGALSTFFLDALDLDDPASRRMQTIRLIAKMPTLAAFAYRHSAGLPYVYPDDKLTYPGNFLAMVHKMTEVPYMPDPRLERALDAMFILHADHEQSSSTNAVRSVGSSGVDPYSAVTAGIAALFGASNGAASQAAVQMLQRIEVEDRIPEFLEGVRARSERLAGFGHREYKSYDPRARIIKSIAEDVYEATGRRDPLFDLGLALEERALEDEFFIERRLFPNIDFYSGLVYRALGLPQAMFPVMFAIARTSGWIAQWLEQVQDPEQKIVRPRQIYTGPVDRTYTPIERRQA